MTFVRFRTSGKAERKPMFVFRFEKNELLPLQ
jgi:hypothetical protein